MVAPLPPWLSWIPAFTGMTAEGVPAGAVRTINPAFAERPFPARFGFRGGSWPVPLVMAWYNFQDWRSMKE